MTYPVACSSSINNRQKFVPTLRTQPLPFGHSQSRELSETTELIAGEFQFLSSNNVQECWYEADFSLDSEYNCYASEGRVFWEDKKRLRFVIDCVA